MFGPEAEKLVDLIEKLIELKIMDMAPKSEYEPDSMGYVREIMDVKTELRQFIMRQVHGL